MREGFSGALSRGFRGRAFRPTPTDFIEPDQMGTEDRWATLDVRFWKFDGAAGGVPHPLTLSSKGADFDVARVLEFSTE